MAKVKNKSKKAENFINKLHEYVISHPQFRKKTLGISESKIQTEIRPIIIDLLTKHFSLIEGYKDPIAKANSSFYWEGQEGNYANGLTCTFGSKNRPDFIIDNPYRIAIEYKQSKYGYMIKYGIGQCLMHSIYGEYDYVYYLFHDQSKKKSVKKSLENEKESSIVSELWDNYNILLKVV